MPVFNICFLLDQKWQSVAYQRVVLHCACFMAIVKILRTAEVVMVYEAGVFSDLQSSLVGCSHSLSVYISLINGWYLAVFL